MARRDGRASIGRVSGAALTLTLFNPFPGEAVIDITALDNNGRQVTDLTAPDFQVEIDGEKRQVATVEYIRSVDPMRVIGAPPKGLTQFDANLPTGILPQGGPFTEAGAKTWHIVPGTTPQIGQGTAKTFSVRRLHR